MTARADGFVPAVGFVVAGFGLAAGLLPWSAMVAFGPVESLPGVFFGLIGLAGFAARRYGATNRIYSLVAGFGAAGVTVAAGAVTVHPNTLTAGLGVGAPVAFIFGVLGIGVATADYLGHGRRAFLQRVRYTLGALFIGFLGLLVGFLFAMTSYFLLPTEGAIAANGIGTVAFSVGLGVVAVGYLWRTDRDWTFLDVATPTRRDWLYVIGGTLTMFLVLAGSGLLTEVLGIPSAEHGLLEQAREAPMLLLAFIPLSFLVIGPGEELLSRNIVQKHLYDGYSRLSAVIVGTGVFAAIHLPAYATGPPPAIFATLVQLFGISLVLGLVYERTDNVVVPAVVHGTYNAVQFAVAYVAITSGLL